MVSILPSERSNWDVIGKSIGQNLGNVLPGAVQQGYNRGQGFNALAQAQQEIDQAQGDPMKIALALSRMAIASPESSRALGPIAQTAMQTAATKRAFPTPPGQGQPQQPGQPTQTTGQSSSSQMQIEGEQPISQMRPEERLMPSPFNIKTAQEIEEESTRYAQALNDPNAFQTRMSQLQNVNNAATAQRNDLEDLALKSGITADELPRFMIVGSKFNPKNPSQWMQSAKREFDKVKSADNALQNTFIPGLGSGLLGRNRDKYLKRLEQPVQDKVKAGLERETRNFLAENYVSPTEIGELIHPLTPEKQKAIKSLPNSFFPLKKEFLIEPFAMPTERTFKEETPFVGYEEATQRAPKQMQMMQDRLADFFLKNVDENTSLLPIRQELLEKDYDWRQIGPAIRQAEKIGLKLSPEQITEMSEIETQPPRQSLPDIFQDFDRVIQYFRGEK